MILFVNFLFKHVVNLIFLMEFEKVEGVLPSPSLSIDILSLINTNDESDGSFDGFEQINLKESVDREEKHDEEQELNRFIRCPSQAHYKYKFPLAKTQNDFCFDNDVFIEPDNICSKNKTALFEKGNVGNYLLCSNHNNSFYVYLNSLSSENNLNKYFRPCHTCKKTYCVCLDSLASYNIPVLSLDSPKRQQQKEEKNKNWLHRQTVSTTNLMKMNKAVETDINITEFNGCRYDWLNSRSSKLLNDKSSSECSDFESCREKSCRNSRTKFSPSHNEKKPNFWCQTLICEHSAHGRLDSGIDTKASFESLRKPCIENDPNVLTWAPFLENAAHNARNLVRDLELIMKTYKSESNYDNVRLKTE